MSEIERTDDGDRGPTPLQKELDELNLTQALRDFEVANARVLDLTQRLVSANAALAETRAELERTEADLRALRAEHEAMRGSAAFRIASRIWAVRNALR